LVPSVFYNPSSSTVTSGTVELPGYGVSLHPGQSGEFSVAQFTAPSTGDYVLSFNFTSADTTANGATADYVLNNGETLYSGDVHGPVGSSSFGVSGVSLDLVAGEQIDFAVGQYRNQFLYDSTSVSATLTFTGVPEPSTWAMMLVGFTGVGFVGYRASRGSTALANG
jgi:hypothetical protein